ncbi:MAG: hypothetical protein II723_00120 [Oscillospiraceae bacterium]|nr:hypothetical protein [Oscillospiraceae bacterium]
MSERSWKRFLKKPGWLHRPTRSDLLLMIASLFIAALIWAYIASRSGFSLRFSNIPVVVDTTGSKAEGMRLTAMSPASGDVTVNAELSGNRTEIGGLSKNDLEAYIDFDAGISDTVGYQTLPVRLRRKNGTVLKNATLSVSTVDVKMDKITSAELEVREVSCPRVSGSTDSVSEILVDRDRITAEPKTITVTGPSEALKQLSHVRVRMDKSEQIYETKIFYGCTDFELIGSDGAAVSKNPFKMQTQLFDITVPVFYQRKLPATVSFDNVPKDFDSNWLLGKLRLNTDREYTLPQKVDGNLVTDEDNLTILIETEGADNKKQLDQSAAIEFGPLSLYDLDLRKETISVPVKLNLSDGQVNRSNLDSAYISVDREGLDYVSFNLSNSDIQIINKPSGYDFSIAPGITTITVCGDAEQIRQIEASDIKAYANLYTLTEFGGTIRHTLTLVLPEQLHRIWAGSSAAVNITATPVSASPLQNN